MTVTQINYGYFTVELSWYFTNISCEKQIMLNNIPTHKHKNVQLLADTANWPSQSVSTVQPVTLTVDITQYNKH